MSCNGEIQVVDILDQTKTYLTTPYYKTIPEISISGGTEGPQYNYSNYDKFCLVRNLEPIFSSLGFTFEIYSIKINNNMILCVIPKLNNSMIQMSDKTQYKLQEEIDYVCSNLYHLCLLYDVFEDNIYPQGWLCNIVQSLEISRSLNPSFINGKLYLSLDEFTDYDTTYSNAFDALMIQISQLYNTGAIVCSEKFAKNWELTSYKNNIYIADWNDNRITRSKSLFLYNLSIDPITTIQIPEDILLYHYLSQIVVLPLIDKDKIQLKIDSIIVMKNILELIDNIKEYTKKYSLSTYQISTIEIYREYQNKILKTYKNADISLYRNIDPLNSYTLSVLIKNKSIDLDKELKSILG